MVFPHIFSRAIQVKKSMESSGQMDERTGATKNLRHHTMVSQGPARANQSYKPIRKEEIAEGRLIPCSVRSVDTVL